MKKSDAPRRLRMGMVGGGIDAFIGNVHRMAAGLDGGVDLVAGALSSTPEKAMESGRALGLHESRTYPSWQAMLTAESQRTGDERIDFVSIVTPNHTHFEIAHAFAEAGIHVVCDKPLVHTSEQANRLIAAVEASNVVFAVTYNYSGYPLVKEARERVRSGELGTLRKVVVEYHQGWLSTALEESDMKQATWRTDPARSGIGGAIGDIGTHAEQLLSYVTGLKIESLSAELTSFVAGRRLDDDAQVMLRLTGGARGTLSASQVMVGEENNLSLRVWGTEGGISWRQEDPNRLVIKTREGTEQVLTRGNGYLSGASLGATRLPPGHPEAFIEAFANVYRNACSAIRAGAGAKGGEEFDYPDVYDGARGVRFIERTVASSQSSSRWTDF